MTFKANLAADVSVVFLNTDEFSQNFTTSASATIVGILDYGQALATYDMSGQAVMATIYVNAATYAAPERYQTLNDGTHTWRVEQISSGDGGMWILSVTRDQRAA